MANVNPFDEIEQGAQALPSTTQPSAPAPSGPNPFAATDPNVPASFAPAPSSNPPGVVDSLVRGLGQGASLGWMDRIGAAGAAGKVDGLYIPGVSQVLGAGRLVGENVAPSVFGNGGHQAFNKDLDYEQGLTSAASQAHPMASLGGQLVGGLATAPLMLEAAPFEAAAGAGTGAKALGALGNLTMNGAIYGGVAGAGSAASAQDMPDDFVQGALSGAAVAPFIGSGAWGLGQLAKHFSVGLSPTGLIGKAAGLFGGGTVGAQALADRVVAQKAAAAGMTVPEMLAKMQAAHAVGATNFTLGDAGGAPVQQLVGTVSRKANPEQGWVSQFLGDRQAGVQTPQSADRFGPAPTNAGQYGANALGGVRARTEGAVADFAGGDGSLETATRLIAQRKANAQPLYDAARADPITMTDGLASILPHLKASGALDEARGLMAADPNVPPGPLDTTQLQPWDYMKQALDTKINNLKAAANGPTPQTKILGDLKKRLVDELDAQSPNYAAARQQFAGDSDLIDAFENGKNAYSPSVSREQVAADVAGMTPAQLELYRLSSGNSLREQIANASSQGRLQGAFHTNSALAQKAKSLAPSEDAYQLLAQRMNHEGTMAATKNAAIDGTQTAARLAADSDTGGALNTLETGLDLAHGNLVGAAIGALRKNLAISPAMRQDVLGHIGRVLTSNDPGEAQIFANRVAGMRLPKATKAVLARAVMPIINQPRSPLSPSVADAGSDEQQPAAPTATSWHVVRNQSDGSLAHWNPDTGEMRPYDQVTAGNEIPGSVAPVGN